MTESTEKTIKKTPIVGGGGGGEGGRVHWAADCVFLSQGCMVDSTVINKK